MGPDFRDRMAVEAKAFDDYLAKILESRKRR
jgi:hypothetical protein